MATKELGRPRRREGSGVVEVIETHDGPLSFSAKTTWIKVAATRIGVTAEEYADALNRGQKICGGCHRRLKRDKTNFGTNSKTFDGLRSRCHPCMRAVKRKHYHANREAILEHHRQYRKDNREAVNAYNVEWNKRRLAELRRRMLEAYGGKCNCCGEPEPLFLELDHIFNDGAEDRRQFGSQTQIMIYLHSSGWPKERFQLLCSNCNQGKNRNGGVCPHKTKNQ